MSTLEVIEVGIRKQEKPIGVMLHGFGSCAENIAPLCNVFLDTVPYWLVLQAPVSMETLLGYPDSGYAWFPKQDDGFGKDPTMLWYDLEDYDLNDLVEAALLVEATLRDRDVFSEQVALAGFSQGGMIATEVALQRARALSENDGTTHNYAALLLFSSAFLARKRRTELVQAAAASNKASFPPVMTAHGKNDEVLLYKQGLALHEFWKTYAPHAEFCSFDGGHEVSDKVCEQAAAFLDTSLNT